MTYVKKGGQWQSLNNYTDGFDHPVATIHATTVLQDKNPVDANNLLGAQLNYTIVNNQLVYADNKNYIDDVTLEVRIKDVIIDPSKYHITDKTILNPAGENAGTLVISIKPSIGSEYSGYNIVRIPILKQPIAPIENKPNNMSIDIDQMVATITLPEIFNDHNKPQRYKDLTLPTDWAFINPNDYIASSTTINYVGPNPLAYKVNSLTLKIVWDKQYIDVNSINIDLPENSFTYTGNPIYPTLNLTYNNAPLYLGTHYDIEYQQSENINASENAFIRIRGLDFFQGIKDIHFTITKAPIKIEGFEVENGEIVFDTNIQRDDIVYTFFYDEACTQPVENNDQLPTTPGNYFMKVEIKGSANYEGITKVFKYNVQEEPAEDNHTLTIIYIVVPIVSIILIVALIIAIYLWKRNKNHK